MCVAPLPTLSVLKKASPESARGRPSKADGAACFAVDIMALHKQAHAEAARVPGW